MNHTIHTDSPLHLQKDDCFQRYEFAKRIANIVGTGRAKSSLVVGLYGKWGEGKSTVMNFIEQELPKETVIVKFNPWLFSDEQRLLKSFFSSVTEAIGASDKTFLEKAGAVLSEYGLGIGLVTQIVGVKGKEIADLGEKLKSPSIEKLKRKVDDLIIESGKNIVVFVDDIDRLSVDEVQYVFKLVKLVADFPRTCYILSFDDEMVAAALSPKYGGDGKTAGYNFLEKIIQMPLKIPKASKASLSKFTLAFIEKLRDQVEFELTDLEFAHFLKIFNSAFAPYLDNPRLGIRYVNTLSFSLPLLQGEVHLGDLMAIEGLKIFYPQLYDFVRTSANVLLTRTDVSYRSYDLNEVSKNEIREEIDAALRVYDKKRQAAAILLLKELFPQLQNVFGNYSYGDDYYAAFSREKRLCTASYFDRYFSYSVAEGDISDKYFDKFLNDLASETIERISERLNEAVAEHSSFDLMQKFNLHAQLLEENSARKLALAIVRIAHEFPPEENFLFSSSYSMSAMTICKLVNVVPPSERLAFCTQLFEESPSMDYVLCLYRWLTTGERYQEDSATIKEIDFPILREPLIRRFVLLTKETDFFSVLSDGDLVRMLLWWKDSKEQGELNAFLYDQLKNGDSSGFAFKLLRALTPTIVETTLGVKGSVSRKADLKREIYDRLKSIVNPFLLNDALIKEYGMNPYEGDPNTLSMQDALTDSDIVSIFQWYLVNDPGESGN